MNNTDAYINVCACVCVRVRVCTLYIYMGGSVYYIYIYLYIYIYIYIYIYTYVVYIYVCIIYITEKGTAPQVILLHHTRTIATFSSVDPGSCEEIGTTKNAQQIEK